MKVSEATPQRTFTIEVSTDELRLIENALYEDATEAKSGIISNVSLWDKLDDYLTDAGVTKIRDDE